MGRKIRSTHRNIFQVPSPEGDLHCGLFGKLSRSRSLWKDIKPRRVVNADSSRPRERPILRRERRSTVLGRLRYTHLYFFFAGGIVTARATASRVGKWVWSAKVNQAAKVSTPHLRVIVHVVGRECL